MILPVLLVIFNTIDCGVLKDELFRKPDSGLLK